MEKQLKDYLHLYLGCDINRAGRIERLDYQLLVYTEINDLWKHTKPILRPLSDMGEEERLYWFDNFANSKNKNQYHNSEWVSEINNQPIEPHWTLWTTDTKYGRMGYTVGVNNRFTSTEFLWLLSKHFDLFGLIESGLAIDKTKL